jgi:hypothetical protein
MLGFLSLSTDVDDPVLEAAGGGAGFAFGAADALDFALPLAWVVDASGSDSPE